MPQHPSLSPARHRLLQALAHTVVPGGGALPLSGAETDWPGFYRQFFSVAPPLVAGLLRLALWCLDWFGWLLLPAWPQRFASLPERCRHRLLLRLRFSHRPAIRGVAQLLSMLVLVPYYQDERVLAALHFTGHLPDHRKESPC